MSTSKPYDRPPLVEAVLAIQIKNCDVSLRQISECQKKVKRDYPRESELHHTRGHIQVGAKASTSASSERIGYAWTSEDGKRVFQAKLDGFAFCMLAPYTSWEDFNREANRLWDIYRKVLQRKAECQRVALRYINRIDFPMTKITIEDYFRIYPHIPTELPQLMDQFFFQLTIGLPPSLAKANITQTIVAPPPDKKDHVSILLDIDVYQTELIPTGEDFWSVFDGLAAQKNRVFENSINDETRKLFRNP